MSEEQENSTDMEAIGAMFQARRKELNLSLKEVESATSIRVAYLQAIEEGKMEKLISPVYAQGFVKQYASFVGLDGDRIIAEHHTVFRPPAYQDFAYGIGTLEMRGNPGAGVKWVPNSVWAALFFVMLIVAYYVARSLDVL